MKQFLGTACLTIVALVGFAQTTEAGGLFRRSRGCDANYGSSYGHAYGGDHCEQPCAPVAPIPAPAPQYEERKVKVFQNVWKEREVESVVYRNVMSEEKFTYTVNVQVWNDQKRTVKVATPVSKEVDYTYTVMVPKQMQKKVQVTTYQCVQDFVKEQVPVCRTICVQYIDECGCCRTRHERVTEMREVTRCVTRRVPVVTEQLVNYTVCEAVQHQGKRMMTEIAYSEREETIKVPSFVPEKREGVRQVCNQVAEKVKHKVAYCERIETEQVVRVLVNAPCHDSYAAPYATGFGDCGQGQVGGGHGGHGGGRGGLFRRGGGGGCH